MRASDADRERVAERLRQAAGEGRLLAHELEERIGRALRAQTYGELDATVSDLPSGPPAKRTRSRELVRAHPLATVAIAGAVAVTVAVVVLVVVAWLLMAWGVWLVLAMIFMASRRGGRHDRRHPDGRGSGGLGARTQAGGHRW